MLVGLISRQQLLKASRRGPWSLLRIVRIVPLERMARHLGVEVCGLRAGYRSGGLRGLSAATAYVRSGSLGHR